MRYSRLAVLALGIAAAVLMAEAPAAEPDGWTPKDCDQFMRELAQYVHDHHLKKDERSEQKGMIYEYFHVKRAGNVDQYPEGEALDTIVFLPHRPAVRPADAAKTLHDGAWFSSALVHFAVIGEGI